MSYKVTIQSAVLEKCIEHVTFNVDTPNHYDLRTEPKNSMIITGKIDTDENTALLYKWALLPVTNPECYKEITVEYTKDNQLVRKVCFSKAFVVDYSENYSNYSGVGTFTLYVRQFRGKDIECIGQTSQSSSEVSSTVEEVEKEIDVVKQQTPIAATASSSKPTMSITDRIAKQKEMIDNGITEISNDADNTPRLPEMEVRFNRNPNHDAVEFERQLKAQEKGMNSLTVDEFIQNRDRYLKEGRAAEGNAAQKLARQEALKEKVSELRKQGLSRQEANKQAEEWLASQAALHNPDQIAGGNPLDITRIGDKRINSSLGSQWKGNIGGVDKNVRDAAEKMTEAEKKITRLNMKFSY